MSCIVCVYGTTQWGCPTLVPCPLRGVSRVHYPHSQALWNTNCTCVESLVYFLTWSWCNQNRTRVFRTERQRFACYSTSFAFNARCVWYSLPNSYIRVVSFPLPSLFSLFWVLGYAHAQLRSFYLRSTFEGSHVRKNTRLSLRVQLQYRVPERRSLGTRLRVHHNCNELLAVQSVTVQAVNTVWAMGTRLVMSPPNFLAINFHPLWVRG